MLNTVLVTQRHFDEAAIAYLREGGCEVVIADLPPGRADGDISHETLVQWLQGASGWIVGHAHVTRELLAALPDLRVIARRGVGYERIDTQAVRDLGRVATIAAGTNDATVADLTIGLMLGLGRRFRECGEGLSKGAWSIPLGSDLYRKTVGIVGLGRIGLAVLRRLRGFDVNVLVHSLSKPTAHEASEGVKYVELDTLLAESDYVTLHAPLTDQTRFLIREKTIRRMKPTAFLINTARGGLVEDRDLLAALRVGRLAGAGLDVFVSESDPGYETVTNALVNLPNVIALPHAGASTREGLARMNLMAARCIVAALDGNDLPPGCVIADGRRRGEAQAA
ncbi:phosphoglycerate dehydrogenase [Cupriavidus oxalaticus]|uniref:Hydroxyacid dehydrogenase n=1 Tax=Cupriavidus oxalaticus TaxID=96344 RepID=A0A4P7LKW2_9BURK|nr:phosphoglycerate dehydrogenase [Cupriavidus oxalaticus]QBY56198.1 hydroxyacid dehydrogenase [Cupriavidus oxalaticus]